MAHRYSRLHIACRSLSCRAAWWTRQGNTGGRWDPIAERPSRSSWAKETEQAVNTTCAEKLDSPVRRRVDCARGRARALHPDSGVRPSQPGPSQPGPAGSSQVSRARVSRARVIRVRVSASGCPSQPARVNRPSQPGPSQLSESVGSESAARNSAAAVRTSRTRVCRLSRSQSGPSQT